MSQQQAPFSAEFIAQQHERLLTLRQQLLGTEENTIEEDRETQIEHGDEAQEMEDEAQTMSQQEVQQALRDVNVQRIAHIERALQKVVDGSYGLSDLSGEVIPKARLESTPEAILTVQEESTREDEQA